MLKACFLKDISNCCYVSACTSQADSLDTAYLTHSISFKLLQGSIPGSLNFFSATTVGRSLIYALPMPSLWNDSSWSQFWGIFYGKLIICMILDVTVHLFILDLERPTKCWK